MQSTNRTRISALSTALVAAVLIGAAALTPAKEASVVAPVAKVESQVPMVGTFTGGSRPSTHSRQTPKHLLCKDLRNL